ncbi:MAG: hypothetical protein GF401_18830 [Chitinivibrionales bacterium]|nr:hypothetical protein [Chitinivibrionales bacterium]
MKNGMFFYFVIIGVVVCMVSQASAKEREKKITITPWGWMTMGEVVKSTFIDGDVYADDTTDIGRKKYAYSSNYWHFDFAETWIIYTDMGLRVQAPAGDKSDITVHAGARIAFNTVLKENKSEQETRNFMRSFIPYPIETSLFTRHLDAEKVKLSTKLGYFSFKYNPDVRNLGEYLFRSGAYPPIVVSGFDIADKTKILGLQTRLSLFDNLHQDFFVHSEIQRYPVYDFSLSYLVNYTPNKLFDIGAGISFSHLISVDEEKTTPGIKAAGRITIDPKALFDMPIFGEEDLKLYTEAAVLGIKDYPVFYDDIRKRIPVMVGFNIPAFNILDVCALEVEYFPNDFSNSENHIWQQSVPIPFTGEAKPAAYGEVNKYPFPQRDDWKWSLFAVKSVGEVGEIIAQAASDHTWRKYVTTGKAGWLLGLGDEELCQSPLDWYWMLRFKFYLK